MKDLILDLFEITKTLDDNDIDYGLCGGLAVAIYGFVRFTKDIDLIIRSEDIEKAKTALAKIEYNLSSGIIPFKSEDGTIREIYRISKAEGNQLKVIDLMICTGFLNEIWKDREVVILDDKPLKVVSKEGLITMKKEAGRPQDLVDIERLNSET